MNPKSLVNAPRSIKHHLKSLSAEKGLNDFITSLKNIEKFAKRFYFDELKRAEYYLFPIITTFKNLTSLRLDCCTVPLIEFYKVGESLSNLKSIELVLVTFIKLTSDDMKLDDIKFPRNLNCLDIYHCSVSNKKSALDPIKFLLSEKSRVATNNYTLPNVQVLSLKKLSFFGNDAKNAGIKSFLDSNPNLDYLKIENFSLSIIKKLNSLCSLEFDIMRPFDTEFQITILENIKRLKINTVCFDYYENIKKLCSLCLNLQELHFVVTYNKRVQPSIDNFLVPVISKLNHLKKLELLLTTDENEKLDIKKFSNIESLIIETESSTIFNLNFYKCKYLKKVEFTSYTLDVNTQDFKDRFKSYKNWAFKFSENTIKGYKL
ncbi:hypothetical protein CONCODRAFT_11255 [Conidiobolus coronatus NRRL 28638]|uniref:RNI-like protein n=1 Tax=Conidiobolus coronatus (strain ATCC 28846 / CBS 209.66 / NRRL 28638) TaxID=796925 RepID=A0A137NW25_CONC2|nr:hypothetical protein CONCODRAFT_11255 [Conidiobolus coronatus NRRL 28638]|eukprot:KXN66814.1 hypothetical protein CONCODRAFT_11255 [Conidiobolus coronatus NRRL 28638]